MSAYKEIVTEFRHRDSLIKALADSGFRCEVANDATANGLELHGYALSSGGRANIRIPKSAHPGAFEDTGFIYNSVTKTYAAKISTHNSPGNFGREALEKVTQRYAYHEVIRQAKLKGYTVQQHASADGTIRLQLTHY